MKKGKGMGNQNMYFKKEINFMKKLDTNMKLIDKRLVKIEELNNKELYSYNKDTLLKVKEVLINKIDKLISKF